MVMKRVACGVPDKKHELHEDSLLTEFNSLAASWVPKRVISNSSVGCFGNGQIKLCKAEALKSVIGLFIFVPDWSR
jgi:hypothetical protein